MTDTLYRPKRNANALYSLTVSAHRWGQIEKMNLQFTDRDEARKAERMLNNTPGVVDVVADDYGTTIHKNADDAVECVRGWLV